MAYPFVAAPDHWSRNGVPVKAIAIHHAEGGGTVSWLTRPDGNSSHYVVEYSGRVVQMVREDRAAGSINPTLVRTTNDAPFTFEGVVVRYGVIANQECLGAHWRNPNAAVIAIEVEGFAKDGPNDKQRVALRQLVDDIRDRHPGVGVLGHRDWQSYKACPGRKIPWGDYGGHGKPQAAEEPDMRPFPVTLDPKVAAIRVGAQLYNLDLSTTDAPKVSNAPAASSPFSYRTGGVRYRGVFVATAGVPHLWLVKASDCTLSPLPAPPPVTAQVLGPGLYEVVKP